MKDFILAGKITAKVREESKKWVKPGTKIIELADKIENRIKELGAKPSFPVNISINDKAAHDTAKPNDERIINSGDVVKIDLGASINGWPGDSAYTVEVDNDKYTNLIKASEEALSNAIKIINHKTKLGVIGKEINDTIKKYGYNPIRNLGGHPLSKNKLHGDFIVPNYNNHSSREIGVGGRAIEPFATTGEGWVVNINEMLIFSLIKQKPIRNTLARSLLKHIIKYYGPLPFTERWIAKEFKHYEYALKILINEGIIKGYNVLREASGGIVAQTEHSLLITQDKTIIITRK